MGTGATSLGEIDGRRLIFKIDNRPVARFLYFHFIVILLLNKRDRQPDWRKYLAELPTKKPFATSGRYLRNSMLLTLAKSAGDMDPTEQALLLGEVGQETFEGEEQLQREEEQEIGRRIFAARETEDDGDGDESDDEEDEELCK